MSYTRIQPNIYKQGEWYYIIKRVNGENKRLKFEDKDTCLSVYEDLDKSEWDIDCMLKHKEHFQSIKPASCNDKKEEKAVVEKQSIIKAKYKVEKSKASLKPKKPSNIKETIIFPVEYMNEFKNNAKKYGMTTHDYVLLMVEIGRQQFNRLNFIPDYEK